ncbi:MAG: LPS-assembly protein LptD [Chitinophagales bacterium]|nr:LPS-assembly protein LptD [Chitinophagales bacterium]
MSAIVHAHNVCFVHFIEQVEQTIVDTSKDFQPDSLPPDSLPGDTIIIEKKLWYAISRDSLDAPVDYSAADSIVYDLDSGITYIYTQGKVVYQSFSLEADYIEFDWDAKQLKAARLSDSLGIPLTPPHFQDGEEAFNGDTLQYNFDSKKGKIYYFKRQEGEGFITATAVKKLDDNSYYGSKLHYTTCDLDHPHFYISTNKAKIVPNKIAVTGPANIVIADVPTPVFLPFGIFPIKRGQTSGIIIPTYGNHFTRGYFLANGGYYFAINDHLDLALTGDIYSRGSWRLNANTNYAVRYRYSGSLNLEYSINKDGLEFTPSYAVNKGFFVTWSHRQDAKARPNSSFSASVNAGTSDYLSNNAYNSSYLTNTLNSSVSYNRGFAGTPFSMSAALRHDQNTTTKIVNLTIPDVNVSMNRIYPLKDVIEDSKNPLTQFGISYNMSARNFISSPDSTLFDESSLGRFENGFSHTFSASAPVKLFKYFTLTPSFSYNENWFFETIRKNYDPDTIITATGVDSLGEIINDTTINLVRIDTIPGFEAARFYSMSASLSTKLYALAQFNKGKLKAIRHVVTPSLSFSYRPDFADPKYGYYGTYDPGLGDPLLYSIFEGGLFGGPPSGKSGTVSLNIGNNLEMKVFSKKDTITNEKNVKVIESFSLGSSYNLAADSLNVGDISMSGYTTLFEKIRLNFSSTFDPYVIDSFGRNLNQFEWDVNRRIGRFNSANISANTTISGTRKENVNLETDAGTIEEREMVWANPDYYIDFEIPWSFTTGYNLRITNIPKDDGTDSITTTQTLTFSGNVSIAPNWKLQVTSGYDFELYEFTYTSVDIYRDLHCWSMSFKWIPFGLRQSYLFNINVKASVLQDLKLTRKKDWSEY